MTTLLIIFVIGILCIAGAFRYNQQLKDKARQCSKEAEQFHKDLQRLSAPGHLFTDEELHKLKVKYNPLLEKVNELYDSHFISKEYLDHLGLGDFMEERKHLNHTQFLNNQSEHS